MPKILELKVENARVWARIDIPDGEKSVSLWTEPELQQMLDLEYEYWIEDIRQLKRRPLNL